MSSSRVVKPTRRVAAATSALAALMALGTAGAAQAQQHEIVIEIKEVRAIDKVDVFSKADFFAVVTIDGEKFTTSVVKQQQWPAPGWVIRKSVRRGTHNVEISLFDKDLTKNDPIDINPRTDRNKRDLDFTVSTPGCSIGGLINGACNRSIKRAGNERKSAEITFTVDVRR